jgi:threonine dehydrogenase-like Zn-dependent dehydrogenase
MRAVVRRQKQLVSDEIAEPVPAAGQVLVRTLACGICGSDLHALHHFEHMLDLGRRAGSASKTDPARDIVFGHEFCAEILDHGPGTSTRLKAGTRVVSMPIMLAEAGFETVGYSDRYPGGFAERMVLMEPMLLEVPNGLADDQAAMTEPFAVGEHAVAQSGIDAQSVALVLGCGPVGLAVIAALKVRGFGPVIAADFSPARRRVAEIMGADIVIDPKAASPHGKWRELDVPATLAEQSIARMTGRQGRRPVVFECVGVPGMLQRVIEEAPPCARIVVAGVCMETDRIEPFLCISKQLDFRFVLGYTPEEFAASLRHIAEGRIDVRPVLTGAVGLDGVAGAFAALANPDEEVKVVVVPGR